MHNHENVREVIEYLFSNQRIGVLATYSENHPYCNLVAFTPTDDLTTLLFATLRATQKYRNVTHNRRVAFLVDNRSNKGVDFTTGIAVTAIGTVGEAPPERDLMLRQHIALTDFILNPDCVLLMMHVDVYIVTRGLAEATVFHVD